MRWWRREEVQESQSPMVPRSRGPKDQDISNSLSNTSLTLKKVHLVGIVGAIILREASILEDLSP